MSHSPEELYPLILDSINEGVFTVDSEFRITSFNAEAEAITGFSRRQALGHRCYEVLRASICQGGCAIRRSLETGEPQKNVRVTVLNPDMQAIPICVSSAVLRDREGRMNGGVEIFRDISEIEALRSELSGRHRQGAGRPGHRWKRGATARALGISRSTLWRRMKEYGLLEVGLSAARRARQELVLQGLDQDS